MDNQQGLRLSKKTFIQTAVVLLAIMIFAGILTRVLPQGSYERAVTDAGYSSVVSGSYTVSDAAPLPIWRWFTAPFEVFASSDSLMAIVIIVFIALLGGTFLVLEKCLVMKYLMCAVVKKYGDKKYRLLHMVSLVFMLLGSVIGMMEETVPLIPIMVSLSLALGWDTFVGLGMSLLSVGFGFAAGTLNVFTVGIAQQLAGLPMFSGILLRIVIFLAVYALLTLFLTAYAKKIEKTPSLSDSYSGDQERRSRFPYDPNDPVLENKNVKKAAVIFVCSYIPVVLYVVAGLFIGGLSDYVIPVMMILITGGGLIAGSVSKYRERGLFKDFLNGLLAILPSTLLIILAMSVKQILVSGGIMDTILNGAYLFMERLTPYGCVITIYVFVLFIEFFISSASAKAFLLMPLLVPLADLVGLTRQTMVQAFTFGDGFTNMFYPTNAMLLIALGILNIPYGKWFKWTWKLQALLLVMSCLFLLFAVKIGWGPF